MQFFRNIFRLFQFARICTQRIYLAFQRFLLRVHPAKLVFLGYLLYLVAGVDAQKFAVREKGPGVGMLIPMNGPRASPATTIRRAMLRRWTGWRT